MRMLHTMLRVGNLEQSLKFYTEVLGMTLLRKRDYEEGRYLPLGRREPQHDLVVEALQPRRHHRVQ